MTGRYRTSMIVFFTAALFLPRTTVETHSAEQPERPNVVLILADDLGYGDLGC